MFTQLSLQCGHGPKAVENKITRSYSLKVSRLQCGHGPKAVENGPTSPTGSSAGSSFNAATARRPWRTHLHTGTRGPQNSLQCGHGPKAVENTSPSSPSGGSGSGFNAATARRPWRTPALGQFRLGPVGLQCGHGPKAVENLRAEGVGPEQDGEASMRPRPEGRGERSGAAPARATSGCFNAATARRPWRTTSFIASCDQCLKASMRPRPEGRGERTWRDRFIIHYHASMRPRPEGRGEPPMSLPRSRGSTRLQCGHGPKAVENRRTRPRGTSPGRGFNAATARRPWRTSARPAGCSGQGRLQCGHGPKAVENKASGGTNDLANLASMRPRPEGRGERRDGHRDLAGARLASMRPRPEGRGEPCPPQADERVIVGASMRPRPEGRGERGRAARRPPGLLASMRPRPEGRGERHGDGGQCHPEQASMRPRPEGRGELRRHISQSGIAARLQCGHGPKAVENSLTTLEVDCDGRSFNAATARRPWRTSEGRSKGGSGCSFNAATARRPWRTRLGIGAVICVPPASMRPRPEGRGERAAAGPTRRGRRPASMRPRPEGRGELLDFVGNSRHKFTVLQCGHGPKAVENDLVQRAACEPAEASMRPRPEGRGEPAAPALLAHLGQASMRPRPEGRGEPLVRTRSSTVNSRLQCGHGPKAVENLTGRWTCGSWWTGFNAATARRPWRTHFAALLRAPRLWLQCGHGPKAVENLLGDGGPDGVAQASMRPRPEGRGEPSVFGLTGAAADVASMRPRPEGRGEPG